ncbi:MAG: alpha/beta hydrolase [Proteobacteria bacterium]|nr:alpha/beta hydrolase [Pseudomonadota bacterium]
MAETAKTIVAVHGAGMSSWAWDDLKGRLLLPCQTLSLPGHAQHDRSGLLPSIEQMAAWVATQLRDQAPRSVILLGHSMGALIALETAPHSAVGALVLLGAAAAMPVHPDLLRLAAENPADAVEMVLKWGIAASHPHAAEIRTTLQQHMREVSGTALGSDLAACDRYTHGAAAAKKIAKPVLVIAGADDKMTKAADGKALAAMMSGAQCEILPDCGHMMMLEKPAAVAEAINAFSTRS